MRKLLQQLWRDDTGAVVSVEILLIVSILMFGLIPGLVAMRNSMNAAMTTLGNLVVRLIPSFTFSGFAITSTVNNVTTTILQIGGVQFTPNPQTLSADQTAPVAIPAFANISPAP